MRRAGRTITAFALLLMVALPAAAEPKDEIAAVTKEWAAAFSDHNMERILALYSKDALLWGTNATALRTTPAEVQAFYKSAFGVPDIKVSFDNQTVRVFGNVAIAAGNYTFTAGATDRKQDRPARYSFTFVKEGGKWVIVDHNSAPMPSPPVPSQRT